MITGKLVTQLLTTGKRIEAGTIAEGLPPGARLVSCGLVRPSQEGGSEAYDLSLLFEHDSFEPLGRPVTVAPDLRVDFVPDAAPTGWGERPAGPGEVDA